MQILIGFMVLSAALAAGFPAGAQSLSCKFLDNRGQPAAVTLTAEAPLFPALQAPHSGFIAFTIEGLPAPAVFPAVVNGDDPSSKFAVQDGQLKAADVVFNQGHQRVRIFPTEQGQSIYLELPYGLLGGGIISRPCL